MATAIIWLTQVIGRLTGTYRVYAMAATQRPPTFVVLVMGNLMAHITGTTDIFQRVYKHYQVCLNIFFSRNFFNNFMILM